MARTDAGWQLTRQHRRQQLAVRAEVLRDFTRLWPMWEGDRDSFDRMLQAVVPLTRAGHRESTRVASGYYQAFRLAEGVPGDPTVRLADMVNADQIVTSLYVTGTVAAERAIRAGRDSRFAMDMSRGMMSGAVGRHVMNGGRDTLLRSVTSDPQAGRGRWQRATGANPCEFCIMLSSRGPAYLSEATAGFQPHDACVTADAMVEGPSVELGFRRWYEGELVIIRLADGHELAVTPNHPVLTDAGWVPAGFLHEGQEVAKRTEVDLDALRVPHEQQVPALAHDVWSAAHVDGFRSVPVAAEDFHGDGVGTQGDVDVVTTDRLLTDMFDAPLRQPTAERVGAGTGSAAVLDALSSPSNLSAMSLGLVTASTGGVSGGYSFGALLGSQGRHVKLDGLTEVTTLNTGFLEPPSHDVARHTETLSEFLFGDARHVQVSNPGRHRGRTQTQALGVGSRFDPPLVEVPGEGVRAEANLGRRLLQRLASGIQLSRIVNLRRVGSWSGHVYNFRTAEGWYSANGVIVSNCACVPEPVYPGGEWNPQNLAHREVWEDAQSWARETGEMPSGTSNDALNALRRFVNA